MSVECQMNFKCQSELDIDVKLVIIRFVRVADESREK